MVCISVKRYFSVSLNLLFKKEDYRRMRSNELNYIDFPSYGVLIKIVPIES